MASHNQLSPYALSTALELRLENIEDTVDETISIQFEETGEDSEGMQRLDLRSNQWSGLIVTLQARIDPTHLDQILEGGPASVQETRMLVSVRCPGTKLRRSMVLEPTEPGVWAGDVSIDRRDVRSRLEFHPLLYRLMERPAIEPPLKALGLHRHALLATGQPVSMVIDDVDRNFGGPIKIKWTDFSSSKNPWLEKHKQTLYYFEYDDNDPILWLNQRNHGLRAVLFERTDDTVDSGLRRLMSGWLAEVVWLQMFQAAMGSLDAESEDEIHILPPGWRGNVLRKFLIHLFPEQGLHRSIEALKTAKTSADQYGALMGKASTVVQRIVGSEKLFSGAVRAAEQGTTTSTGKDPR